MILAWLDWVLHMAVSPGKRLNLAMEAMGAAAQQTDGATDQETLADPRFVAPEWAIWPFQCYRDTFLRVQQWWEHATTDVPGVESHHEQLGRHPVSRVRNVRLEGLISSGPLTIIFFRHGSGSWDVFPPVPEAPAICAQLFAC
ncbi:hypothetical protein A6V36_28755 [Paraburkholderia ginsengiterrae]|uniref:Poly-beta-hydroxybutyrate polymerase N-terminal domain-containing protein n=2 Tax=Paraburkholderia ginsengiterrae TaxID=1462993 RepID=A0A1A9MZP1_9BURK|nr:hypothetical protein A6V37_08900 [Paraburkholderia ginsengiterrae]OAJ59045.1 hypothetical protein A6V36_28755 [Paraburkholderia ginsengiterrae]